MQVAAAAALIALYVTWFAFRWVGAGFTPDDLMNCHRALIQPLGRLLLDHLTFFLPSPDFRPAGSLFYRAVYRTFGFDPLPFHLALQGLQLLNAYLTYLLVKRLTGNTQAAWIATALHAWHGNWAGLWQNTGLVYDVLCYAFSTLTLLAWDSRRTALFFALFVMALNCKELAVSLPVICLVWELVKAWPTRPSARRLTYGLVAGGMSAAFIAGRLMQSDGLMSNPAYQPHFDWATFANRVGAYLTGAIYYQQSYYPWAGAAALAGTGWALWKHPRPTLVSLALSLAAILPVAFIAPRGFEAAFLASLGAVTIFGLALADLLTRCGATRTLTITALPLLLAGCIHYRFLDWDATGLSLETAEISSLTRQFRQLVPIMPRGAHVRLNRNPLKDEWNSLFLSRLLYHDLSIEVSRPGHKAPGPYDVELDWEPDGGGPGQGVLRRRSLEATKASTAPKTTPSK